MSEKKKSAVASTTKRTTRKPKATAQKKDTPEKEPTRQQDTEAAEKPEQLETAPVQQDGSGGSAGGNEKAPGGFVVARVLKVTKPLMKGEDVKALQTALIARGYHCGTAGANGIFGRETAHAVRCFQAYNRLIVNGQAERFTVTALGGEWKG
jgi:peptidoglycan hydrolase-like protein with peptidoglycan-binding domain